MSTFSFKAYMKMKQRSSQNEKEKYEEITGYFRCCRFLFWLVYWIFSYHRTRTTTRTTTRTITTAKARVHAKEEEEEALIECTRHSKEKRIEFELYT
jgi:hypothetical protein